MSRSIRGGMRCANSWVIPSDNWYNLLRNTGPGPATGLRNVPRLGDTAPTIYSPFHCYCSSLSEESWNLDCSINWIYTSQTKIYILTQCSVLLYQGHGFLTFLLCSIMSLLKSYSAKLRLSLIFFLYIENFIQFSLLLSHVLQPGTKQ